MTPCQGVPATFSDKLRTYGSLLLRCNGFVAHENHADEELTRKRYREAVCSIQLMKPYLFAVFFRD